MNKINWTVRLKNKNFWLALVPAIALLLQAGADIFGIKLDFGVTIDKILVFINVLFALLVLIGIVNDPTTAGFSDSERALGYEEPHKTEAGTEGE
ncbi:holin [Streptococcus sp. HMSC071H03]|uniref:Phage holin n=2 Tax=Streptococcus anginosus TaxID=1328 RepID=A0AAP6BPG0_STRAP|nr:MULTISPECIES: phage holin [Streptococcus]MDX5040600.1 phage holin [Streptococcus anginosus]OFR42183.1 holin [Streptococcus sp. HMSC071H03]